jgi:hypothetical protein
MVLHPFTPRTAKRAAGFTAPPVPAKIRKILLFLKKKKQKDFLTADAPSRPIAAHQPRSAHKSLFCFFFLQKKEDSFPPSPPATAHSGSPVALPRPRCESQDG